jgi:hypothetical protein
MSEKIQLPIDLQELCAAFEDSSDDHRYFLDFQTGEVNLDIFNAAEREKLDKMVDEASKERYRYLPIAESQVGYEDMKEFIETVKGHGITAGIFNDSRGLINSAVCRKCGSHDIFFDF